MQALRVDSITLHCLDYTMKQLRNETASLAVKIMPRPIHGFTRWATDKTTPRFVLRAMRARGLRRGSHKNQDLDHSLKHLRLSSPYFLIHYSILHHAISSLPPNPSTMTFFALPLA
ncbi:hypothetical protein C8J56DRAFT_1059767 [Mycena floridula]|nr:hypothetical protein C8J56DRAFT_1059767 [Mycena floridula]